MAVSPAPVLRAWASSPAVQDAALAAGLLLPGVVADWSAYSVEIPGPDPRTRLVLWWLASAVAAGAVAVRRRWPVAALGAGVGTVAVHLTLVLPLMPIDLSVPVLLYSVAAQRRRAVSLAALGALLLLALASSTFAVTQVRAGVDAKRPPSPMAPGPFLDGAPGPRPEPDGVLGPEATVVRFWAIGWDDQPGLALILIAAWAIGAAAQSRRAYLDELRARAADLERERDQRAALAVASERGRISRELHDVVAHGLSVMVVQAQGGEAALDRRPADTRAALHAIIQTGRDSLADMRRVLAAVGADDDAWHPPSGLGGLPALVDQVRAAGVTVRLSIHRPVPVPAPVDLSAFRIVQEALTNAMKHAGPDASVDVVVAYSTELLDLTVTDDGHGPAPGGGGAGNGLRGMRERVRLLGGRFEAGPARPSGFRVHAALPIGEVA